MKRGIMVSGNVIVVCIVLLCECQDKIGWPGSENG